MNQNDSNVVLLEQRNRDPAGAGTGFIATKLEAFAGRFNNAYLFGHDLGDLLAVDAPQEAVDR